MRYKICTFIIFFDCKLIKKRKQQSFTIFLMYWSVTKDQYFRFFPILRWTTVISHLASIYESIFNHSKKEAKKDATFRPNSEPDIFLCPCLVSGLCLCLRSHSWVQPLLYQHPSVVRSQPVRPPHYPTAPFRFPLSSLFAYLAIFPDPLRLRRKSIFFCVYERSSNCLFSV